MQATIFFKCHKIKEKIVLYWRVINTLITLKKKGERAIKPLPADMHLTIPGTEPRNIDTLWSHQFDI